MKTRLLVFAFLGLASGLAAQNDLQKKLPIDPSVRTGVLSNGMRYYVRANAKPEKRAELRMAVNVGSTAENDDQQGLAHFTEHMAFNGSKNFKKNELVDYLESVGTKFGPHLNAYTSFDETVYMIQIPTDKEDILQKGFQILEDWSHNLSFDSTEIDKERGVVTEEWRLGQGANERMRRSWWPVLFKDSRYAERLPIGKKDILQNCSYETLRNYYRDWYRPDLMAVMAVGDFDPDKIVALIKERFSKVPVKSNPRPLKSWAVPDHTSFEVAVTTDKEATNTVIQLMYMHPVKPNETEGDYRRTIVQQLYNGMMNQRLEELRKSADAPFVQAFSGYDDLVRTKDLYYSYAMVREDGIEKGLTAVVRENERVRRHGFTATELERQKKDVMRAVEEAYNERDKNESRNIVTEMVSNFLKGESMPGVEYEYNLYKKYLPGITVAEINAMAVSWLANPENAVMIVTGPQKEGVIYPSNDRLKTLVASAKAGDIQPYVDKVIDKPLVEKKPAAGKVKDEKKIGGVDVTMWKLSNGATVYLKSTDFKNDEILFTCTSLGGTSLYPDSNYLSADYSNAIVEESGLGVFDKVSLDKLLQGKIVGLNTSIDYYTEGLSGNCSPRDMETFFQLIYLYFTAPRKDTEAFWTLMKNQEAMLQNRLSSPEAIFQDTIAYAMSGYNYRSRPMSAQRLKEVNLDRALEIYRSRFADASNFTFTFVGNFKTDQIRPMIEMYIGGLPSSQSGESFRDLGIQTPKGKFDRVVMKGVEPKSSVSMKFTGPFDYTRKNRFELNALMKLLSIKLRENLREEKGGVYGVGAYPVVKHYPKSAYEVNIAFGCSPDNVTKLSDAAMVEIQDIRTNGCTEKNLQKVKETFLRERETYLKENSFWMNTISQNAINNESLAEVLEYNSWVESLKSDDFKRLANRYLAQENFARFVLNPEKLANE